MAIRVGVVGRSEPVPFAKRKHGDRGSWSNPWHEDQGTGTEFLSSHHYLIMRVGPYRLVTKPEKQASPPQAALVLHCDSPTRERTGQCTVYSVQCTVLYTVEL